MLVKSREIIGIGTTHNTVIAGGGGGGVKTTQNKMHWPCWVEHIITGHNYGGVSVVIFKTSLFPPTTIYVLYICLKYVHTFIRGQCEGETLK